MTTCTNSSCTSSSGISCCEEEHVNEGNPTDSPKKMAQGKTDAPLTPKELVNTFDKNERTREEKSGPAVEAAVATMWTVRRPQRLEQSRSPWNRVWAKRGSPLAKSCGELLDASSRCTTAHAQSNAAFVCVGTMCGRMMPNPAIRCPRPHAQALYLHRDTLPVNLTTPSLPAEKTQDGRPDSVQK